MGHDCGSVEEEALYPVRCFQDWVSSSHTFLDFLDLGCIPLSWANFSHLVGSYLFDLFVCCFLVCVLVVIHGCVFRWFK